MSARIRVPPSWCATAVTTLVLHAWSRGVAGQTSVASSKNPIHKEMFVPIGGIDQWITIKSDDRRNPVVLFLHRGSGDAASPFADAMFAGWDRDLTMVQ